MMKPTGETMGGRHACLLSKPHARHQAIANKGSSLNPTAAIVEDSKASRPLAVNPKPHPMDALDMAGQDCWLGALAQRECGRAASALDEPKNGS